MTEYRLEDRNLGPELRHPLRLAGSSVAKRNGYFAGKAGRGSLRRVFAVVSGSSTVLD